MLSSAKGIATALTISILGLGGMMLPVQANEVIYTGFRSPVGIALDAERNLYVSNWGSGTVERIAPSGAREVFARGLSGPSGIAIDDRGFIYVATYSGDTIERFDRDGRQRTVATGLKTPAGIAFGKDGKLLIANRAAGEVLSLDLRSGKYTVLADGFATPVGIVQMPDSSLVVSQFSGRVTQVAPNGERKELGADVDTPGVGIIASGEDAVFVVDYGGGTVRHVRFDGTSEIVTDAIAGSPVALARDKGHLLIGTWGAGNLYRIPIKRD